MLLIFYCSQRNFEEEILKKLEESIMCCSKEMEKIIRTSKK